MCVNVGAHALIATYAMIMTVIFSHCNALINVMPMQLPHIGMLMGIMLVPSSQELRLPQTA